VYYALGAVSDNREVTKKGTTTQIYDPQKQDLDSKSAAERDACQTSRAGGSLLPPWKPAGMSFLLCTGLHPTDKPRNIKGGLTSDLTVLWVDSRVPLQAPSPDRYAGGQGSPAAQHGFITVRPPPGQLWSKNSAFSIEEGELEQKVEVGLRRVHADYHMMRSKSSLAHSHNLLWESLGLFQTSKKIPKDFKRAETSSYVLIKCL